MGDAINIKSLYVDVQENGIIRRANDGYFIARLSGDMSYDELTHEPSSKERIEELERERDRLKELVESKDEIRDVYRKKALSYREQNQTLIEALEWYANWENYVWHETGDDPFDFPHQKVDDDKGEKARQALQSIRKEGSNGRS